MYEYLTADCIRVHSDAKLEGLGKSFQVAGPKIDSRAPRNKFFSVTAGGPERGRLKPDVVLEMEIDTTKSPEPAVEGIARSDSMSDTGPKIRSFAFQ